MGHYRVLQGNVWGPKTNSSEKVEEITLQASTLLLPCFPLFLFSRQARPPRRNNNNQEAAPASATNGTGAQGERPRRPRKPRRANPTRVFMAGVPSDCELSVLQSQFPAITKGSVRKQVAFVFFDSVESADAAVSRNGEDVR